MYKLKNVGLTDNPSVPQHTGLHTSAWPLIPEVSNTEKSCGFEIKSTQPGSQIYVSIDRFLLAIIS